MDLFDSAYENVKYIEIPRRNRRFKSYVVTYCDNVYAGAYYKTKDDAIKFSEYLRSKNDTL
jgi:hypothetical protein